MLTWALAKIVQTATWRTVGFEKLRCKAEPTKLSDMKCGFISQILAIGVVPFGEFTSAQSAVQSPDAARSGVVLTKLAQLRYPPLAGQARIQGDVEIAVGSGEMGASNRR
jgi:hypothetical protein